MIIYDLICFIRVRCVLLFPLECIRPEESEVWWELTDPPGLHNRALKAAKGPCSNESALRLGKNQDFRRRATCFLGKVPWKCALGGPSWDPELQQSISRVRTNPFPSAVWSPNLPSYSQMNGDFSFWSIIHPPRQRGDWFQPCSGLQTALQGERRRLALHPGVDASILLQMHQSVSSHGIQKTPQLCTLTLKFSLNAEIFRPPTTTASLKHLWRRRKHKCKWD